MKRHLAIPTVDATDQCWRQQLLECGFEPQEIDAMIARACSVMTWEDAGASDHALALLKVAHCGTWYSVEGLSLVVVFMQGVSAGKPMADLFVVPVSVAASLACTESSSAWTSFTLTTTWFREHTPSGAGCTACH